MQPPPKKNGNYNRTKSASFHVFSYNNPATNILTSPASPKLPNRPIPEAKALAPLPGVNATGDCPPALPLGVAEVVVDEFVPAKGIVTVLALDAAGADADALELEPEELLESESDEAEEED